MDWTYILTTALGSGGLASVITWLFNRELYKARAVRDREDVWKGMYESNKETTIKIGQDYERLLMEFIDIKRLVVKVVDCKHYAQCPARYELRDYKQKYFRQPHGQSRVAQKGIRNPRDNPIEPGGVDDPDGQPP